MYRYTCTKQITCRDLNCDQERAECIEDRFGQSVCKCLQGYQGDGVTCEVIPSRLIVEGYSDPEDGVLFEGASFQPTIKHTYDVTNHGPSTLRNVEVEIMWPLEDADGNEVFYKMSDSSADINIRAFNVGNHFYRKSVRPVLPIKRDVQRAM